MFVAVKDELLAAGNTKILAKAAESFKLIAGC